MSYPERLLTEGESIVTSFRPHWRLLVVPLAWAVAGLAALIVMLTLFELDGSINLVITLVIVLALVPLAAYPFVKWWFTAYVLTNERLIKREGVVARSGIEIPLENITNVVFNQNVLERLLKSGDLLIESAGESGQSRFDNIPEPEEFQSMLYRVREERAEAHERRAAGPGPDPTERLQRLAQLHRDGVISDDEFEEKRQELLDEI